MGDILIVIHRVVKEISIQQNIAERTSFLRFIYHEHLFLKFKPINITILFIKTIFNSISDYELYFNIYLSCNLFQNTNKCTNRLILMYCLQGCNKYANRLHLCYIIFPLPSKLT